MYWNLIKVLILVDWFVFFFPLKMSPSDSSFRVLYLLHKYQFRLCNSSGDQLSLVNLCDHFHVMRKNKVEWLSSWFCVTGASISLSFTVSFKLWHGCDFTDVARLSCLTNCLRYSLLSPQVSPALKLTEADETPKLVAVCLTICVLKPPDTSCTARSN